MAQHLVLVRRRKVDACHGELLGPVVDRVLRIRRVHVAAAPSAPEASPSSRCVASSSAISPAATVPTTGMPWRTGDRALVLGVGVEAEHLGLLLEDRQLGTQGLCA